MKKLNNFKNKILIAFLIMFFALTILMPIGIVPAHADVDSTTEAKNIIAEDVSQKAILSNNISKVKCLYNYDGSPDYLYVEFNEGGYAIFANGSNELLEYSPNESIVADCDESIVYGGPITYYTQNSNIFTDIYTNSKFVVDNQEKCDLSYKARELFNIDYQSCNIQLNNSETIPNSIIEEKFLEQRLSKNEPNSVPALDENNLISPTAGAKYVQYMDYFTTNPTHGTNNGTSCTTVATQLMLSYNNYYNDRRLIPNRYLNGTQTNDSERNPNYCADPMLANSFTLGSNQLFHDDLFDKGVTSYPINAKNSLNLYLSELNEGLTNKISYTIKCKDTFPNAVSTTDVLAELDASRPLVLSTEQSLNGTVHTTNRNFNHSVLAYGYQYLAPYSNGITYLGYVVHFGWTASTNQIWTNSAWYYTYMSLQLNHTHNYNTVGAIGTTGRTEYKCSTCGHRTDAAINMTARERYVERVTALPNNNGYKYQDYYVTFKTAGNKLFQTFGSGDAKLYLYDSEYNQLAYNDDSGYRLNSLFSYTVKADTPYILRTQFYNSSRTGTIKIGITAADTTYSTYEYIQKSGTYSALSHLSLNTTKVLTYTPSTSGTYTFDLNSTFDNYLYVIDPYSSNELVSNVDYNDDGGTGNNAKLTKTLDANVTYFIICSKYNPSTSFSSSDSNVMALTVSINGQTISSPSYLQLSLVSRSGFIIYNWEVKISNPNSYAVQVTYNSKMCFESDAKNYTNLSDLVTITIPANSSVIVTINGNGTAGWITACIDYRFGSYNRRRVTCANGLSGSLTMNTPVNRIIDYT